MKYLLLIYEDERVYGADKLGEEVNKVVARHMTLSQRKGWCEICADTADQ